MGFLVNLDNGEVIYPDMIEEEQWSDPSIITEHILEDGGAIADHQRDLPVTCTIKMMVSDSPIEEFEDCANRPAPPSTSTNSADFIDYPKITWEVLRKWKTNRNAVKYVGGRRTQSNFMIETINVTRNNASSGKLLFDIPLKEVRFAETRQTTVKRVGKVQAKEETPAAPPKGSAAWHTKRKLQGKE